MSDLLKAAEGNIRTSTILEIEDTVLLEDWTSHGLDDNAW